jgi:hypothetical protein
MMSLLNVRVVVVFQVFGDRKHLGDPHGFQAPAHQARPKHLVEPKHAMSMLVEATYSNHPASVLPRPPPLHVLQENDGLAVTKCNVDNTLRPRVPSQVRLYLHAIVV